MDIVYVIKILTF